MTAPSGIRARASDRRHGSPRTSDDHGRNLTLTGACLPAALVTGSVAPACAAEPDTEQAPRYMRDPCSFRRRVAAIYHAQCTRASGSNALAYTGNIFRINFKLGLSKGLFGPLFSSDADD